jgi:hypothetical protein
MQLVLWLSIMPGLTEAKLQKFLTLALDRGENLLHTLAVLSPRKADPASFG